MTLVDCFIEQPWIDKLKLHFISATGDEGRRTKIMRTSFKTGIRSNVLHWSLLVLTQSVIFGLAAAAAFAFRFDFAIPQSALHELEYATLLWIAFKSVSFQLARLNHRGLRYVSIHDINRLLIANLAGSAVSGAVILAFGPARFPRSIFLSDLILSIVGTVGFRVFVRLAFIGLPRGSSASHDVNCLIYGAGDAGIMLLRKIRTSPGLSICVRGFVDDDKRKQGMSVLGAWVFGGGDKLGELARKFDIGLVLISIPSAGGTEIARILGRCHQAGVKCQIVPGIGEIIEGRGLAGQIRDVSLEDLLGRNPVQLEATAIRRILEDKVVLVTGAAGSIGSELCRQIARFGPRAIIGFEIAESPLFEIDREMRRVFPDVPFYPEIGSIQNRNRLEEVFRKYRPSAVYHAAAYKHVPLMETHVFEAVENNVFGTYNVAIAAKTYDAESFVLISSDKAVRPANIMGATKRVAELLLQTLQNGGTQYAMVRFGNVLGSSGSVVPIFKSQIAAGGPVTVTHPEMKRFFMTIPEACQLVLQAAAIAEGGQVCVLDMGEPVKIADLARNLIFLSGFTPDREIRIEYSGIRPGEKLCEELSTLLENTVPTHHQKVRIYSGDGLPFEDIDGWLENFREICRTRDLGRLVIALKETVLDYNPSSDLLKRAIAGRDVDEVFEANGLAGVGQDSYA